MPSNGCDCGSKDKTELYFVQYFEVCIRENWEWIKLMLVFSVSNLAGIPMMAKYDDCLWIWSLRWFQWIWSEVECVLSVKTQKFASFTKPMRGVWPTSNFVTMILAGKLIFSMLKGSLEIDWKNLTLLTRNIGHKTKISLGDTPVWQEEHREMMRIIYSFPLLLKPLIMDQPKVRLGGNDSRTKLWK